MRVDAVGVFCFITAPIASYLTDCKQAELASDRAGDDLRSQLARLHRALALLRGAPAASGR